MQLCLPADAVRHPCLHQLRRGRDLGTSPTRRSSADDAVTGRISYPTAVQLEDESIFAFYGINKACEPLPEEEKINGENIRVYLGGSRFHQDWVRPEPVC